MSDNPVAQAIVGLFLAVLVFGIIETQCHKQQPVKREPPPRVAYEMRFKSGHVDTLFVDEWSGLMYDSQGRRVRVGDFETSKRLGAAEVR